MGKFLISFVFLLLAVMISRSVMGSEFIDCNDVYFNFFYCQEYIEGDYYYVPSDCCVGLKYLNSLAQLEKTAPRLICQCIETNAGANHPPFSYQRIQALHAVCHVHLSFPISERMDCSKV
ncbi:hypothetical protein M9H77_29671 [Catharanthus roseus]|uniref:Uncharacterized protein n=1 Tax=Catharanthus roseus TaxID=4058 RepID=A0ACB9ZX13_CATRO|nr:hypothetical protein M9H77_29671 [Catharanthus roseus]